MHQALGTGDRRENEINKVPVLLEFAGQWEEKDYEERNKQIKSLIMNWDKCYLKEPNRHLLQTGRSESLSQEMMICKVRPDEREELTACRGGVPGCGNSRGKGAEVGKD